MLSSLSVEWVVAPGDKEEAYLVSSEPASSKALKISDRSRRRRLNLLERHDYFFRSASGITALKITIICWP